MKQIHIIIFILLFQTVFHYGNAQQIDNQKALYSFFDGIVGLENSDVHYGLLYQEKHRIKSKKSKFFPEPDFVKGSITFNGQPYYNVAIKYDVFDDELLLLVDKNFGGETLQLHKLKVDNFNIDGHYFNKINNEKLGLGYFEILAEKPQLTLLAKHRKSIKEILGKKMIFYEFEAEKNELYLEYKNQYYSIEKYTDVIAIFPRYEGELKSYYQNLDSNINFQTRLKDLIAHLESLFTNETTKI